MNPTPSSLHVNKLLTGMSVAFMQSADNFVAAKVFPLIQVLKQSDRYAVYDRGDFNRNQMQTRAPGTESAGAGYKVDTTPTYYCTNYALHKDVDDDTRDNADDPLSPDRDAMEFLTMQAMISREMNFVNGYFKTGVWTTDITGVASGPTSTQAIQWDSASSTPIEDIRAAKTTILESTGYEPNTLTIGARVFDKLIDHPDIVDRVKYGTQQGVAKVDVAELSNLLKIPNIYISKAIQNTALEGATNTHAFIGGKNAMLCYSEPNPGLQKPSAGYTFGWKGLPGGQAGVRINQFRMEHLKSDRVEIEAYYDLKRVAPELGYFWSGIIA